MTPWHIFSKDGEDVLGFEVGTVRTLPRNAGTSILADEGYLVHQDGTFSPWKVRALSTIEGKIIAWGPLPQGFTRSLDPEGSLEERIQTVRSLALALQALGDKATPLVRGSFTSLAYYHCGNAILVLPPRLVDFMVAALEGVGLSQWVEPYRFPLTNPKDLYFYGLGAWFFKSLTLANPYQEHEGIPLAWARMNGVLEAPERHGLRLDQTLSDFVRNILVERIFPSSIKKFIAMADHALSPGAIATPNPQDVERATLALERARKRSRRGVWWRTYGTRVGLFTGILALVLLIPATMLSKALEPPKQLGQDPRQVVEGFYRAAEAFDLEYLEDVAPEGDKLSIIAEAQNAMLVSKIRMASEYRETLVTAAEWRQAGAKEVDADIAVFGAENLEILELKLVEDGLYEVRVRYDWFDSFLGGPVEGASTYLPKAIKRTDTFQLEWNPGRKIWVVSDYKSLEG